MLRKDGKIQLAGRAWALVGLPAEETLERPDAGPLVTAPLWSLAAGSAAGDVTEGLKLRRANRFTTLYGMVQTIVTDRKV